LLQQIRLRNAISQIKAAAAATTASLDAETNDDSGELNDSTRRCWARST